MKTETVTEATEIFLTAIEGSRLTLREFVKETSYVFINARLERYEGNQCRTARALGVHRNTLSRILTQMKREGRDRCPSLKGRPAARVFARITGTEATG